jgi:tRNA dimethylallyltransferase
VIAVDFPSTNDSDASPLSKIVVVTGPTAIGKTAFGVELALRFGGEVINADSRYFYRGMEIGVAKPSLVERRGVPHHLIDIRAPDEDISLATYQELAMESIAEVLQRGRLPLLVGGTPLYLNAVVEGWTIPRVAPVPEIRARLEAEAAEIGLAKLTARLHAVDPASAERSGQNLRRVVRALEVHEVTGRPMSEQEGKGPRPFAALELCLAMPRDALYQRIDDRVHQIVQRGLVGEVKGLLDGGLNPGAPAMSSIGYRQLLPYFAGEATLDEVITRIKLDTHRFVRKQMTWFRHNPRLVAIDVTVPGWVETTLGFVERFLEEGPIASQRDWDPACVDARLPPSVTLG